MGYKVSYKLLRQQGEEMKAAAKLIDSYGQRVAQIGGRLGEGELLQEVRSNLQKLRTQFGESGAVLNTAGELLLASVESYGGAETRQVKKVDSYKAHNRDFYKNPIVVASAGASVGGMAGAVPTAGAGAAPSTAINYTDNSVNVTYNTPVPEAGAPAASFAEPVTPAAAPMTAQPSAGPSVAAGTSAAGKLSGAATAGILGGAAGAGAVLGGAYLKKRRDGGQSSPEKPPASDSSYDPEAELEKALQRVRDLEEGDGDTP